MVVQVVFGQSDVLNRRSVLATLKFNETIDPKPAHCGARSGTAAEITG
jgi:hypothetical protein